MVGNVILMEFESGWKGFFIFVFLILLISAGMPQLFPSYRDSLITELEGAQNVSLTVPEEGEITLSWEPMEGASYLVLQDTRSSMVTAQPFYKGEETRITFPRNGEEDRYYAVMAVTDDTQVLIGIATTAKVKDPLEDYMNNPLYAGFTGGRHVNLLEAKGFIVVEFFSFWWILAGLFIAYVSVSAITGDFEGKRMDLIFSTPISRERYILEKFTAMSMMSLVIILVAVTGLISSITAMGLSNELDSKAVVSALIGCLPFFMVFAAFGMLTAVIFQRTRVGIGVAFAFVIGGFFLYTFGGYSESLRWMKSLSIMNYWDYYSVVFDGVFKMGDFVGLFIAAFVLIGLAILIFKKKDIPT
ncbi:MAG: ABC transporter permease subunit [Candidatus Methanofastidiosia archaeon]